MSDGRSDNRNPYDIKSNAPPSRKEREKDGAPAVKKRPYSLHRRNSSAPLVPPNPNELDIAYSSDAFREWLGTKSMLQVPGSWFSRLMEGGRIWSRRASTVTPASRPPAPPSRCPVMDLVELTASLCSPKKFRMAWASSVSPIGVEVPWAFT